MKTIKISDQLHEELTAVVGELIAESGHMKTCEDAIEALFCRSIIMPPEVLREIEDFIGSNKHFGYATKEEFLREAARWQIEQLSKVHKHQDPTNRSIA